MPSSGSWLRIPQPRPGATTRLLCLPHAGGNAGFVRAWPPLLPAHVELVAVQYPGRLDRLTEPCVDDVHALADRLADAVGATIAGNYAVFGHSLGASVGYELAVRRQRAGHGPRRLFVSARTAPHRPVSRQRHLADDDELWRETVRLGGTGAEIATHAELRRLALPALRADYRAAETYHHCPPTRLHCPVTALVGDADPEVSPTEASRWADATTGGFELVTFPGGHFYHDPDPASLVAAVTARLAAPGSTVDA